ncbi:hypothetical protein LPJ64_005869 [Coemansia asiatica]|uniref:Uncharacterized protein n=1 Tax=Coemansia asiatica TaxID=1052880 RepID=A0A9W8CHM9_9FUNG|nr:hypothetical protein LPJ64_005869 [Coemansia asiatica]
MSPNQRKRDSEAPKNNTRLDKFFLISKPTDGPVNKPPASLDAKPGISDTNAHSSISTSSSRRPALIDPLEPVVEILDSDSGSDVELVDASSILGIPPAPKHSVAPRHSAKHHNTLKRLVRETEKRKYNFDFLEKHVQAVQLSSNVPSGNNSDRVSGTSDSEDSEDEEIKNTILGSDMARIKAQLVGSGAAISAKAFPGLSVFTRKYSKSSKSYIGLQDLFSLDTDGYAARLARINSARGGRLAQKAGDKLLQEMCLAGDPAVAVECFSVLDHILDMRLSEWRLSLDSFFQLLDRLLGQLDPIDAVVSGSQDSTSSDSTDSSTPSVYVEIQIAKPPTASELRCLSSRAAWLLDIASRALDVNSTEQSAQVVATFVCCVVDQNSRSFMIHMQKSLARLINGISPSSRWTQVLSIAVAQIAQRFSSVPISAQLFVVEALPTGTQQCSQLRQALSLAFLDLHVLKAPGSESSTIYSVHPAIATAQLVDSQKGLFVVGTNPDFVRLEASVCLLGCALDGVQTLRDHPLLTQKIRKCLAVLNRRINDGLTEGIARTLAKDAVQILLTRIDMVTASTSAYHEPNAVYGHSTRVLDSFWETKRPVL